MRLKRHRLLQVTFALSTLANVYALLCYECFETGPAHKDCTRARNCTGSACLLYESADAKSSSAFCLLGPMSVKALSGCWMDSDGKGRHCLCASEFCNKLVDRTQGKSGNPFSSPLPEMELLRQNPLVDYTYIEDEKNVAPVSANGALPNTIGETVELPVNDAEDKFDGDDDLVPIDFAEYKDWESKHRHTAQQGNHADNPNLMDEFVADVDKMIGDSRTTTWRYERVNNSAKEGSCASAVALMGLLLIPLLA